MNVSSPTFSGRGARISTRTSKLNSRRTVSHSQQSAFATSTRRHAFTLVEMLVVITIIAIVASLGFYLFGVATRTMDSFTDDIGRVHGKLKRDLTRKRGPIANQYVFVLKGLRSPNREITRLQSIVPFKILHVYDGRLKGFAAKISSANAAIIKNDPAIDSMEQDQRIWKTQCSAPDACTSKVLSTSQCLPTGFLRINLHQAAAANGRPSFSRRSDSDSSFGNVAIAVIDSGVDVTHPDLNVTHQQSFISGKLGDVLDRDGHGTHVAGTIAARDNGIGTVGIVPNAQIFSLKVLDESGTGAWSDLLSCLSWLENNAQRIAVANVSVGGPRFDTGNLALEYCVEAGVTMVVAAGNDGDDAEFYSPASAASAITVAALVDTDGQPGGLGPSTSVGRDDTFACFSNFGKAVDVIAPGVEICSCQPAFNYKNLSGTSMAAPHVAGLAARIHLAAQSRSYLPTERWSARLTCAEILHALQSNSTESIRGPAGDSRSYKLINAAAN